MKSVEWWELPVSKDIPENWLVGHDTNTYKLIVGFQNNDGIRPFNGYGPKAIIITDITSYCIMHDHYEFKDTSSVIFRCYKELYGCNDRSDILKLLDYMNILEDTEAVDYELRGLYNSKQ